MLALAHASSANNIYVADWPYRFASWAFDQPDNVALWLDDAGELIAWAVLQTPFWTLDYVMRPDVASSPLHRAILAWADAQARAVADTRFGRPMWFVNVMMYQTERIRDLEAMGWANQADAGEDAWSKVLMARSLTPLPLGERQGEGALAGFTLRPLDGVREVEAYVALHRAVFESESMTPEWRARTLMQPDYAPDLDLVFVAPDGGLGGFCVCWLDGAHGQVEPMGIRADLRGRGLGKALLTEGLRRLRAHGAERIFIETDNYRNAAFALYESVGFRTQHDVCVFRKDYA